MRAVGVKEFGVEAKIIFRGLVDMTELPGQQPRVGDAVRIHVGNEAVFVALMPTNMLM